MNGRYAAVVAALFAAPVLLLAQVSGARPDTRNAPVTTSTLHLQANLIYVPVTVTDSQGTPVSNLRQEDFVLTEDGQPQPIRLFEQQVSRPMFMVLAIDTSLSVQKDLSREKQAADNFVHAVLRRQDRLALTGFARQVTEYVPFTTDPGRLERGLNTLRGDGPTALYAAIVQGAQMLEGEPGRRIIVVISDGANSMPGVDYKQAHLAALHAEASIESVILVPIAASAGRNLGGEHALIQLSRDTGGQYFYVHAHGELHAALALLAQSLHNEYLLGYYAPPAQLNDKGGEGEYRHIEVKMSHPGIHESSHLYFRKGYLLGPKQ